MRRYLLVVVVLWPICCHTGIPWRRHRTWHPPVAVLSIGVEYTATHFYVLGNTRPGNHSPTFHTHQRTKNNAVIVVVSQKPIKNVTSLVKYRKTTKIFNLVNTHILLGMIWQTNMTNQKWYWWKLGRTLTSSEILTFFQGRIFPVKTQWTW